MNRVMLSGATSLMNAQMESMEREEDPILAKEAMAGNVKLMEGLLLQDPKNSKIQLFTAKAFFAYAFGFVDFEENPQRASLLFMRGLEAASRKMGGVDFYFHVPFLEFQKKRFQVGFIIRYTLLWFSQFTKCF